MCPWARAPLRVLCMQQTHLSTSVIVHYFFSWNAYGLWETHPCQHWKRKYMVWIKRSRFLRQSLHPDHSWTTQPDWLVQPLRRGKGAKIRAISKALTQDCSRLSSGRRKIKWKKNGALTGQAAGKQRLLCPQLCRDQSPPQTLGLSCCTKQRDCVLRDRVQDSCRRRWFGLCVYISDIWCWNKFELIDTVSQMLNF